MTTNIERAWFRVTLVAATVALIVCTALSARAFHSSRNAGATAKITMQRLMVRDSACPVNSQLSICDPASFDEIGKQLSAQGDEIVSQSEFGGLTRTLAWVLPLLVLLAFYVGRWAMTGRTQPAWPLRNLQ